MSDDPSPPRRDGSPGPPLLQKKEPTEEINVRRDTLVRLCRALEEITYRMKNQIYWLKDAVAERALRWRCLDCGRLSHFSKPEPIAAMTPCSKCRSERAEPLA